MLPEPLHPAIVHFPIVLGILLPISALATLWAIRRGAAPRKAWAITVAVAGALFVASFVAVRTGEAEEDRVEHVVSEATLHEHEEAGERFLLLSGVLALIMAAGLAGGTVGSAGRWLGTAGTAVLVVAAVQVGSEGGELVYEQGAASAYVDAGSVSDAAAPARYADGEREDHDDDDGEEH